VKELESQLNQNGGSGGAAIKIDARIPESNKED